MKYTLDNFSEVKPVEGETICPSQIRQKYKQIPVHVSLDICNCMHACVCVCV